MTPPRQSIINMPPKRDQNKANTRSRDNSPSRPNVKAHMSDTKLFETLNSTSDEDIADFSDNTSIIKLLRYIGNNQARMLDSVEKNKKKIQELEIENLALRKTVNCLEEDTARIDQYSRKNVMTVTGYRFESGELQCDLERSIIGMLNKISPAHINLTMRDFIAIHRNSREGRNGRPPTITVKFIRYYEKDLFFNKAAIGIRKSQFTGVGFHHNLCSRLISEQQDIKKHTDVKFVNYMGDTRFFSVCLNSNTFLNRIRSYGHFVEEFSKMG